MTTTQPSATADFSDSAAAVGAGRFLFVAARSARRPGRLAGLEKVRQSLENAGWVVGRCLLPHDNPGSLRSTELSSVRDLIRAMPRYDVVSVFFSSGMDFTRHVVWVIVLARFLGKKTVLLYCRNEAELDLEGSSWWMVPFLKLCDDIIVTSQYVADRFVALGLSPEVIAPAIEIGLLRPRPVQSMQPRLLVVRSLEKRNNVTCVVEAFALVKQKYPRAELVIVGDGSERQALRQLVERDKVPGVTFIGWLDRPGRLKAYADADVYVNASSVDGLPLSLLEALAAGLPVVTTAAGGIPEVVQDRVNGLLFRSDDPAGLADRIIELIENPVLVRSLSEQGRLSSKLFRSDRLERALLAIANASAGR